jgi:hypothetical protein
MSSQKLSKHVLDQQFVHKSLNPADLSEERVISPLHVDSSPEYTVNILHDLTVNASSIMEDIVFSSDNESEFKITLPKEVYPTPAKAHQSQVKVDKKHKRKHKDADIQMKKIKTEQSASANLELSIKSDKPQELINAPVGKVQSSSWQSRANTAETGHIGNDHVTMLKQIGMYCEAASSVSQTSQMSNKKVVTRTKGKAPSKNPISHKRNKKLHSTADARTRQACNDSGHSASVFMPPFGNYINAENTEVQTKSVCRIVPKRCSFDAVLNVKPVKTSAYHQSPGGSESKHPEDGYESGSCSRSKVNPNRKLKRWNRSTTKNPKQMAAVSNQMAPVSKQHRSRTVLGTTVKQPKVYL